MKHLLVLLELVMSSEQSLAKLVIQMFCLAELCLELVLEILFHHFLFLEQQFDAYALSESTQSHFDVLEEDVSCVERPLTVGRLGLWLELLVSWSFLQMLCLAELCLGHVGIPTPFPQFLLLE